MSRCRVEFDRPSGPVEAETEDLSAHGLFIRTDSLLPFGEETEIRLPANVRLLRDPPSEAYSLELPEARFDYLSTVQRDGSTLKLSRSVTIAASSAVCTPGDLQAQRTFVQQVERSLRTQLLYE